MHRNRVLAASLTVALATTLATASAAHARAWQFSDATLVDVRHACRDGLRLGVAVSGAPGSVDPAIARKDYPTLVSAIQPATQEWTPQTPLVVRSPIVVPRVKKPTTVPIDGGGGTEVPHPVSHLGVFTVRALTTLATGPIAVSSSSTPGLGNPIEAEVEDCYLFAPVDVVPGNRHNNVRIGRGDVQVALLSTRHLRADRLDARTFTFGPKQTRARSHQLRDVNRDGRRDLVLTFRTSATGLTCASRTATLTGQTRSGGLIEGRDKVNPTHCRR